VLPETVAGCKTFGDWLLLPLLCRPEAAPLRAFAGAEVEQLCTADDSPWQVFLHHSEDYRERPGRPGITEEEAALETSAFDPELLEFAYPYQRETGLPAKVTATQLKGRTLDQEIAENAAHTPYLRPLTQPKFRQERRGLTPAERGTATHLVLQYLDFSDSDVSAQVEALRKRELLTVEQAAAVDVSALERFLASPLASDIRQGRNILREYPFTLLMDAREYDSRAAEGDTILLQGVVDCCFETDEGLTVVDFKTDHVRTGEEIAQRAEHYRTQLEAYSRVLEQVLEKQVVRRALYFLTPGATVEV
jgi:ATP-dependent helicase/nuclease subunit A